MSTAPISKQRGNDLGPTGREVARNVKRVRVAAGLTQQDVADRLAEMNRPIPVASIGKIETGDRRVEVDDLVALSIALDVTPVGLLMPYTIGPTPELEITGHRASARELWSWALGEAPLKSTGETGWNDPETQSAHFIAASFPWWLLVLPTAEPARTQVVRAREFLTANQGGPDVEHPEET